MAWLIFNQPNWFSICRRLRALVPHGKGTALLVVAEMEHIDIVRLLLESGASHVIRDPDGKLALDKAREAG